MPLVLRLELHALVRLHIGLQLLVAHHCVAEQSELVPSLLLLVLNQLLGEVLLHLLPKVL